MKTGRAYLQFFRGWQFYDLAVRMFQLRCQPAGKPKMLTVATSRRRQANMLESIFARPAMKSCTKRTSKTQRISRPRCMTGTAASPVTVPGPRT